MDLLVLIAQIIAFLLAFIVLIILVVIINFFLPKGKKTKNETVEMEEKPQPVPKKEQKLWERYPPIEKLEFVYWQGVDEPWKYNVFALELIKHAKEHLPLRHMDFLVYNTNRKSEEHKRYKDRIEKLRKYKTLNFPLIVINYDQEMISVESNRDFEDMKARIDSEWDRYYGLV